MFLRPPTSILLVNLLTSLGSARRPLELIGSPWFYFFFPRPYSLKWTNPCWRGSFVEIPVQSSDWGVRPTCLSSTLYDLRLFRTSWNFQTGWRYGPWRYNETKLNTDFETHFISESQTQWVFLFGYSRDGNWLYKSCLLRLPRQPVDRPTLPTLSEDPRQLPFRSYCLHLVRTTTWTFPTGYSCGPPCLERVKSLVYPFPYLCYRGPDRVMI